MTDQPQVCPEFTSLAEQIEQGMLKQQAEEIKRLKGEKQIAKDVILGIRAYATADGDDATYVWLEEAPQRIIDLCDGLLNGALKE